MKYHPSCAERFGSLADARAWARSLFQWYNAAHHHSGIGLLPPATVHHGQAPAVRAARQTVLAAAYVAHPERFVRGRPQPPALPEAVWINPPARTTAPTSSLSAAAVERTWQTQPAPPALSRGFTAQRPLDSAGGFGYRAPAPPAAAAD